MVAFEVEQKYRVQDPRAVRALLRRMGAREISSGKESNEFFDQGNLLKKQKIALRLRHYQGQKAMLTLKGPRLRSRFTKRLEIETPVVYRPTKMLLEHLGFKVRMRYAKHRETYRLKGALVTLDQLRGFGFFLEIEGSPKVIPVLAKDLGLKTGDREERSYLHMLFGWKS